MTNSEFIKYAIKLMPSVTLFEERIASIVIKHKSKDWDFITQLALKCGCATQRWMKNKQALTTIYL